MKLLNLNGPDDFLALLFRRKWWVLLPFIGLSCTITLIAVILPKTYVSDTLTLIRARDIPTDLVRDLIAGTAAQRLSAIEQTVLSRSNLVQILSEFEEQLTEYRGLNIDQAVLKLRSQIQVTLERRNGYSDFLTYFRISYQNQNPALAQRIASKLTALFIEADNRARATQVSGTTEFLSDELEKISEQLRQSETRLKDLKGRRRYELPNQLETNLRTLDRLGLQKQSNAEALDRYATIRLNLDRQLSETPPFIPQQAQAGLGDPAVKNPLIERYVKRQLEFEQLSAKYTPRHPEVEAARVELNRLKEKIPPEELALAEKEIHADTTPAAVPNPLYLSLTAQLREVKMESEIREKEKEFVAAEIEKYNAHVQNAPESEQEIATVLRENTDLTKQHDDLKDKLAQARLSESLENKQKGSQFVIVDPANYPLESAKPDKLKIALVGAVISLVIGIILAVLVDVINQKIWTQSEIENLLGVTVLIEIPEIVTNSDLYLARRKKVTQAATGLALSAAYVSSLYLIYVNQAAVLRRLDPVIQRFMY